MVKGSVLQSLQKFGMDAFKAAVAHNQNNVSRLGFLADGGYDFLRRSLSWITLAMACASV